MHVFELGLLHIHSMYAMCDRCVKLGGLLAAQQDLCCFVEHRDMIVKLKRQNFLCGKPSSLFASYLTFFSFGSIDTQLNVDAMYGCVYFHLKCLL